MKTTELYRYTGNEAQLFGVRRMVSAEGRSSGNTVIQAYTAGGLEVEILPDNGLDLGLVRYNGKNVSYFSKNGYDSPSAFLPYEKEFINTFPGGMLYTCGLRSVGPPNRDGEEWQPQHGRLHSIQASQVCASVQGENIIVSGILRESALFGHLLQMRRTIKLPVWGGSIEIEDEIENLTPNPQEYMLLYHFNFGYPMLSEHAELELPTRVSTTPRTPDAQKGIGQELEFIPPVDNMPEQVFFHEMKEGEAVLENHAIGISAVLRWSIDTLPVFAEWKSMRSGDYVLGLEPANNYIMGRSAERENGTLKTLDGFDKVKAWAQLDFKEISK